MERSVIQAAAERVRRMEYCFDVLKKEFGKNPDAIVKEDSLRELLQVLTQYYESGQWLHDYELDEKGLFPDNLKRGVLAQDSVYDLLAQIEHVD